MPTMTRGTTDADSILRRAHDLRLDERSDAELLAWAAAAVADPRRDPADSFVLHAPLELLARAALLPFVAPERRARARLRVVALVDAYEAWAPAPFVAAAAGSVPDPAAAAAALAGALVTGDLDAADVAARGVATDTDPADVTRLVGAAVLPNLAAAAHGSIFLMQLPRVAPRGEATAELLRPLARELARNPGLAIEWVHDRPATGGSTKALAEALQEVPALGVPGSSFIFPLMHQVDAAGTARALLGPAAAGLTARDARPVLLRHAARAMLLADPAHAPYGWSHCLTMPQAALVIAERSGVEQLAVDVAATYVVGFLAGLATAPVPTAVEPADPGGTFADAIAAGRDAAAGWVLARPDAHAATWTEVLSRAAGHHDAHLVKYSLACRDEAAADPAAAGLYLAAAASLLAFWESFVNREDPLAGLSTPVPADAGR
jgi:hypothetical protein